MKEKYFTSTYHPISSTEAEHGLVTAEGEEVQLKLRADRNPDTGELQFEITVLNADALDFPDDFARLSGPSPGGCLELLDEHAEPSLPQLRWSGLSVKRRLYDVLIEWIMCSGTLSTISSTSYDA